MTAIKRELALAGISVLALLAVMGTITCLVPCEVKVEQEPTPKQMERALRDERYVSPSEQSIVAEKKEKK